MDKSCTHDLSFLSRRQFLFAAGAAGFLGIRFPQLLAEEVTANARADHCILIWLAGGPSHIDTFDPKPGHRYGGPFKAISTRADGIQLAENFPMLARQMHHASLVRSMTSREGSHKRATYYVHTGYKPMGSIEHPSLGAIVIERKGKKNEELPAFVSIGRRAIGAGYLGNRFQPFIIGDPSKPAANVNRPAGISAARFSRRMKLLESINAPYRQALAGEAEIEAYDEHYADAIRLMRSRSLQALDVSRESEAVRQRYGPDRFAQGCLLARRLVAAGVRFVELTLGGWDTHADNFTRTRQLTQKLDRGLANLLIDLQAQGLLARTLVLCIGEFGRTPRINGRGGRDHYPRVFSALLAGGGVRGGQVVGSSAPDGGAVRDRAVTIGDLHATLCHSLGIDPSYEYTSPAGRPFKIVREGKPVLELF